MAHNYLIIMCVLLHSCIDAEVQASKAKHTRVLIPILLLVSSDCGMPFVLSQCQYPVCLSSSMSIRLKERH